MTFFFPVNLGMKSVDIDACASKMDSDASSSRSVISCSVCLETVEQDGDRSTAKLKCAHQFHLDCIGSAFNAKGAMQCPNCRHVEDGQWLYAAGVRPTDEVSFEDYVIEEDNEIYEIPSSGDDVILANPPVPGVSPLGSPDFDPFGLSWGPCPHLGQCPHPHYATISFEGRLDRHVLHRDDLLHRDPLHNVPVCPYLLASHNARSNIWEVDVEPESPVSGVPYRRSSHAEHHPPAEQSAWRQPLTPSWSQAEMELSSGGPLFDSPHRFHPRRSPQHGHAAVADQLMPGMAFGGNSPPAPPPIPSWFDDSPRRLAQVRSFSRGPQRYFPNAQSSPGTSRGSRQNMASSSMGGRRAPSPDRRSLPSAPAGRSGAHVGGGPNGVVVREGWRWRAEAPGFAARGEASLAEAHEPSRSIRLPYQGHGTSSSGGTGSVAGAGLGGAHRVAADAYQDVEVLSPLDGGHPGSIAGRESEQHGWRTRHSPSSSFNPVRSFDLNGPPGLEFRCLLCNDLTWRDNRTMMRRNTFGDFSALRQHTIARHSYDPRTGVAGTSAL